MLFLRACRTMGAPVSRSDDESQTIEKLPEDRSDGDSRKCSTTLPRLHRRIIAVLDKHEAQALDAGDAGGVGRGGCGAGGAPGFRTTALRGRSGDPNTGSTRACSCRPTPKSNLLSALRAPARPSRLHTRGPCRANPFENCGQQPGSHRMSSNAGLCEATGSEPEHQNIVGARRERGLNEPADPPYAVVRGASRTLKVLSRDGDDEAAQPDPTTLGLFLLSNRVVRWSSASSLKPLGRRYFRIEHLDPPKIDVEGSDMLVFKSGRESSR